MSNEADSDFSFATMAGSSNTNRDKSKPMHVYLNVYNLVEANRDKASGLGVEALNIVGMGIHHSGVECFGEEWSFGGDASGRNDPNTDGIFSVYPRTAVGFFKEQIDLGEAPASFTRESFEKILEDLRPQWRSAMYHILSKNCNYFSRTLIEAIDAFFPAGTPKEKLLVSKVPGWVNRAAGAGSVVVPNALVQKITNSLAPPSACAPDLVNFIDIPAPLNVPMPPPIGPLPIPNAPLKEAPVEAEEKKSGFGMISSFASKAASAVKNAVISQVDEMDRKDYVEKFKTENVRGEDLLSAYACTVIHINRPQSAKVFIAKDAIRICGEHNLSMKISYRDIKAYHYGAVVMPQRADGNALPQISPTSDVNKTDCVLLFLPIRARGEGLRMIPLLDLSFMGSFIGSTAGLVSNAHRDITKNAMAYVDNAHRKYNEM